MRLTDGAQNSGVSQGDPHDPERNRPGQSSHMYDTLFAFVGRTGLEPDCVTIDAAIQAGQGHQLAADLLQAATEIEEPNRWGRISLRYLAGQRVHAVIHGTDWWNDQQQWPPPYEPAELPDEIATIAELLNLLVGGEVELPDPPRFDTATWARVLPLIARLEPFQLLDDDSAFAETYNAAEQRLKEAADGLERWLTTGPRVAPGPDLWEFLAEIGGLAGVVERPAVLLEHPQIHPQLRAAALTLLDNDAISGVPELRVAHALRFVSKGEAIYNSALLVPSIGRVEFLSDLAAFARFYADHGAH